MALCHELLLHVSWRSLLIVLHVSCFVDVVHDKHASDDLMVAACQPSYDG